MSVDIEDALIDYLIAQAAITAVISTRLYPDEAPQNPTFPYAVVTQEDETDQLHLRGTTGVVTTRFSIECHARGAGSKNTVKTFRSAVRTTIGAYQGTMGTYRVQRARLGSVSSLPTAPQHGEGVGYRGVSIEAFLTYTDTALSI